MSPTYNYYISFGIAAPITETEVHPQGDWKLKISKAEEDFSYCKDYRIKFDGDFEFSGVDYDLIMGEDCCEIVHLRITCDGKNYWWGYFSFPYDFEIDEDLCVMKGTPKPFDKYFFYDLYADEPETGISGTDTLGWQRDFPAAPGVALWSTACVCCEPLWDILTQVGTTPPLWPVGYTTNLVSTFLQNDLFPDGTNPYPTNDYVTETLSKNHHIIVAMAKDVRDLNTPAGANCVDFPEWSWNEWMEFLHNHMNTWWYIDENGDVRIEHILFWELYFGASYDLTTLDGGHWIKNSSKYDYIEDQMPKTEEWEWADLWNNFEPSSWGYMNDCYIPGGTFYRKKYSIQGTTDLEYVAGGPAGSNLFITPASADVSDDTVMLLRCIPRAQIPGTYTVPPACTYFVWFSEYLGDGLDHLNAHFAPANLLVYYWRHDRPFWTGNNYPLAFSFDFFSTWKNLRQTELIFPVCCDNEIVELIERPIGTWPGYLFDFGITFLEPIITQYGYGELEDGNIKDGMLTCTLGFEDECGAGGEPINPSLVDDEEY